MATGESEVSLDFAFRVSQSWISVIVRSVFRAIRKHMMSVYLMQKTTSELYQISKEFERMWDFPNVVGAIDGKHVRIKCPPNSTSVFFNYKDFYSVVLMAIVDASYRFIGVDIGSFGREGDAGIIIYYFKN